MRRRLALAFLFSLILAACQSGVEQPTPSLEPPISPVLPLEFEFGEPIDFARGGVRIILPKPLGWEELATQSSVIIAERFARLADRGVQHGLMASISVTPLSEFPDTHSTGGPSAREILIDLIAARPDDKRRSGDVQPFTWRGYDAAYYLVSEAASGPQMLIVGLTLPDEGVLLTGSVSAPRARAGQIRAAAPLLLGGMTVNAVVLGPDDLDVLPDPLVFPPAAE